MKVFLQFVSSQANIDSKAVSDLANLILANRNQVFNFQLKTLGYFLELAKGSYPSAVPFMEKVVEQIPADILASIGSATYTNKGKSAKFVAMSVVENLAVSFTEYAEQLEEDNAEQELQ